MTQNSKAMPCAHPHPPSLDKSRDMVYFLDRNGMKYMKCGVCWKEGEEAPTVEEAIAVWNEEMEKLK